MKFSVIFLTTLAGLAQATPLPAPQTDATVLHARQLPNPFAILPLIAEIPQGVFYFLSSPINLAKAFGSSVVEKGASGLNNFLDKLDKKRKMKNGASAPGKEGPGPMMESGPGGAPGPGYVPGQGGPAE